MSFKLLGGGSDLNTIVNDVNQNILEMKNREVTEIFKDDTGTRRVILDKDGLRTSPPGVDVVTAANSELTFNSNQNVFKIVDSGTEIVTADNSGGTGAVGVTPVTHNLGYVPAIFAFLDSSGTRTPLPAVTNSSVGATEVTIVGYIYITNMTTTTFEIAFSYAGPGSQSATVKYFLMQETAI